MVHLPQLIHDLGIILFTAAVVSLVFKKIKQPIVLGYLLAGFLVGPEIKFLPTVQETDAIKIWAELGVIFLLFNLGLEFSFKKLFAVGKGATVTALTEILFMFGLGYLTGQLFGWNPMDSIFLGGILSISSTTIIIRAFEELGLRQKAFVPLVFGVLIVEDLVAILLLVLLSTIAIGQTFEGMELVYSASRLVFFLTIWFLAGIFLIPWILRKIRPLINTEISILLSLSLCLLMVIIATHVGFSPALGAFIMGSLLAETPDGESIEHNLKSIRDLFSAIFFVSVGMLIEIEPIKDHWVAIIVITVVTIVGKIISTTAGALIGGQSLKTSVQSGMSLAQIGEFSFIIATLGLSLKVISPFLYPLAVTVSAITTLTTPYLIKWSDPFYLRIKKQLPEKLQVLMAQKAESHIIEAETLKSKSNFFPLFLNSIIVIALSLIGKNWILPLAKEYFVNARPSIPNLLTLVLTLLFSLPFMLSIFKNNLLTQDRSYPLAEIRNLSYLFLLKSIGRFFLLLFLINFIFAQFISAKITILIMALLTLTLGYLGKTYFLKIYSWVENQFLENLNEKEKILANSQLANSPLLAPWDAHLTWVEVPQNSQVIGKSLFDIKARENFGVGVVLIQRGFEQIIAPSRDEMIYPFDRLYCLGSDADIDAFATFINSKPSLLNDSQQIFTSMSLFDLLLTENSPWINQSIKELRLRQSSQILIVGIERKGERILNPNSDFILQSGDQIWIVGEKNKNLFNHDKSQS